MLKILFITGIVLIIVSQVGLEINKHNRQQDAIMPLVSSTSTRPARLYMNGRQIKGLNCKTYSNNRFKCITVEL